MIEKKIRTIKAYQGDLLNLQKNSVELSNGAISTREWIKHPGAACCIPILPNSKIGLIKQFRYAIGKEMIELPTGKIDKNEKPIECARRELEEDFGYKAQKFTFLTVIHPTIGFCNEKISIYLAEEMIKTKTQLEPDEIIELIPTTMKNTIEMVECGLITDVKTIIGLLWYEKYLLKKNKRTV